MDFITNIIHPDKLRLLSHLLPAPRVQEQPPALPRPSRAGAIPISWRFCSVSRSRGRRAWSNASRGAMRGREAGRGHPQEAVAEQDCPWDARRSPARCRCCCRLPLPPPAAGPGGRRAPGAGSAFIAGAAAQQRPLRARAPPAPAGTRRAARRHRGTGTATARGRGCEALLSLPAFGFLGFFLVVLLLLVLVWFVLLVLVLFFSQVSALEACRW